uniref:HTH_Tnp_Tc3_1 domain-containing protein n=1 Tax=Heterorhabditis bacteriophora TaxID=37862 RepID=A0A1I7X7J9_HETBA
MVHCHLVYGSERRRLVDFLPIQRNLEGPSLNDIPTNETRHVINAFNNKIFTNSTSFIGRREEMELSVALYPLYRSGMELNKDRWRQDQRQTERLTGRRKLALSTANYTVRQIADVAKRSRNAVANVLFLQEEYEARKSSGRPSKLNDSEKRNSADCVEQHDQHRWNP